MNKQHWSNYLETPRKSTTVKIDKILKKRMESFLQSRVLHLQDK